MSKLVPKSEETAVAQPAEKKTNPIVKKVFSPKNVIILILLAATLIASAIASAKIERAKDMQEDIDALFEQTYNELIIDSRSRSLAYDIADFTPFDVENATRTRLLLSLFEYTSYNGNSSLGELLTLLNDYIGENRMYPDKPYDELSDELYDDLFQLSRDFGNRNKAKAVVMVLKGAIGAIK